MGLTPTAKYTKNPRIHFIAPYSSSTLVWFLIKALLFLHSSRSYRESISSSFSSAGRIGERVQQVAGGGQRRRCGPSEPRANAAEIEPQKEGLYSDPSGAR